MLRVLLIVQDSSESAARAILARLVHDLDATAISVDDMFAVDSDDDARKRRDHRARQQRYRQRKRDASASPSRVTRDAAEVGNSDSLGGVIHSLPALEGQEGVSDTPNGDASVTRHGDAVMRDAVTHQLPPMSDEMRDNGRAQAARLRDQLRGDR